MHRRAKIVQSFAYVSLSTLLVLSQSAAFAAEGTCQPKSASALDAIERSIGSAALTTAQLPVAEDTSEERKRREFNTLHPYFAEGCTTTQYVRRTGKFDANGVELLDKGGTGGHEIIFIKGACKDDNAGYPRLKLCGPEVDLTDPDAGTGVSVNQVFENVNLAVFPGYKQFFRGGLESTDTLTNDAYEKSVRDMVASGLYQGIRIKDSVLNKHLARFNLTLDQIKLPENRAAYDEVIARESIGTDYALNFARDMICTKIPINSQENVQKMIDFINTRNDDAQKSGYAWDLVYDNCSHLVSNAFAAAGIVGFKETHKAAKNGFLNKLKKPYVMVKSLAQAMTGHMPDMSLPANNVIRMAEIAFERDIRDAEHAYSNKDTRRTLNSEKPWVVTDNGAMMEINPILPPAQNEMFVRGRKPVIAGDYVFKKQGKKLLNYSNPELPGNERLYELESNLSYSIEKYSTILANREAELSKAALKKRGKIERFYDTIAAQKKEAEENLKKLHQMRAHDQAQR